MYKHGSLKSRVIYVFIYVTINMSDRAYYIISGICLPITVTNPDDPDLVFVYVMIKVAFQN